jgi:hypothetical protein
MRSPFEAEVTQVPNPSSPVGKPLTLVAPSYALPQSQKAASEVFGGFLDLGFGHLLTASHTDGSDEVEFYSPLVTDFVDLYNIKPELSSFVTLKFDSGWQATRNMYSFNRFLWEGLSVSFANLPSPPHGWIWGNEKFFNPLSEALGKLEGYKETPAEIFICMHALASCDKPYQLEDFQHLLNYDFKLSDILLFAYNQVSAADAQEYSMMPLGWSLKLMGMK